MGNPAKQKGKNVEREIAELFSKAYCLSFQRVPNSGGWLGGSNATRMAGLSNSQILLHRGDIIPPDELPGLIIESKGRKTFEFHQLFERSLELNSWIDQTEIDWKACDEKGIFLVVFKPNRRGFFVCTRASFGLIMKDRPLMVYGCNEISYTIQALNVEWLHAMKVNIFRMCGKDPFASFTEQNIKNQLIAETIAMVGPSYSDMEGCSGTVNTRSQN